MLLPVLAILSACASQPPLVGTSVAVSGLPEYSRATFLETTSEKSANVSMGDLNGDGHLDILLAKGRHWPLANRILFGDGQGHFTGQRDLGEGANRTYSAELVDLDADGDLDVVLGNDRPDEKLVYHNDGNGNFSVGSTYGDPDWPSRNARVADLNGDGLPDIIVANRGKEPNYICYNQGQGLFGTDCVPLSEQSTTTISPVDLNRDGLTDLIVPSRDGGRSYVYLNTGDSTFTGARRVPFGGTGVRFRMAEAADVDGDGLHDIVAIDEKVGVSIFFGRSGGFSSPVQIRREEMPYALALSDLNLDGHVDIVVGHIGAPTIVYFGSGSGRDYAPVSANDHDGTAYGFAVGDVDGDTRPDLAVARSGAPNVVYLTTLQGQP